MLKKISLYISLSLSTIPIFAQYGLGTGQQTSLMASTYYQPANLTMDSSNHVGVEGLYFLQNNAINVGAFLRNGNTLGTDYKAQLISELGNENRLQQGYRGGFGTDFWVNSNTKVGLSVNYSSNSFLGINNPKTVSLVLDGNKPYLGDTIRDKGIFLNNQSYSEIGIALGHQWKNLHFAGKIKFIQGWKMIQVKNLDYTFFTAADGTEIYMNADYDVYKTPFTGKGIKNIQGSGIGLDLGLNYQWKNLTIGASAINLGFISWGHATHYNNKVSADYIGFNFDVKEMIKNTIQFNNIPSDTVQQTLIPDSTANVQQNTALPAMLNVNLRYTLMRNNLFFFSLHKALSSQAPTTSSPIMNIGYQRKFGRVLLLGVNGYMGGLDQKGLGGMIGLGLPMKGKCLSIFASMENALGFKNGKGVSANGGLQYAW